MGGLEVLIGGEGEEGGVLEVLEDLKYFNFTVL